MSKTNIDMEKLNELFQHIRMYEGENLRTNKYDDEKMIKIIEKEIRRIVEKEEKQEYEI